MQLPLRNSLVIAALTLASATLGQNAIASPGDLRWESVIGIIQGNNVVGSGKGAVTGAPGPWSALGGHAEVDVQTGHVNFDVRGLVLAAGNSIGTPGAVLQVRGTLVCDTDGSASGGDSVLVDTPLVDLDGDGTARFNGDIGALPVVCSAEPDTAFLLRVGAGKWIATGVVLR